MWMKLIPLAVFQSVLMAAGQVLLKLSLQYFAPVGANWTFMRSFLLNWRFALCGVCYLVSSLLWMYIVKNFPLSQSYPMVSLSFVFCMIAAIVVFHETVDLYKWLECKRCLTPITNFQKVSDTNYTNYKFSKGV